MIRTVTFPVHVTLSYDDEMFTNQETAQQHFFDNIRKEMNGVTVCDARILDSFRNLGIKRFLRSGNLRNPLPVDTDDLLDDAASLLDAVCSHDIFGEVVFEGEDGKCYVLSVEGYIGLINPKYLKEIQKEDEDEELTGLLDSPEADYGERSLDSFVNEIVDELLNANETKKKDLPNEVDYREVTDQQNKVINLDIE